MPTKQPNILVLLLRTTNDDTIVLYSTDNGPHYNTWPDAGITLFRSEKNTNWEGAFRVPAFVRWPKRFKAGTMLNGILSHQDWLPTFVAAAGQSDVTERLLKGHAVGKKTFRVHADGYNALPYLAGETKVSPRNEFFYVNDDGELVALRYGDWKVVFKEQRAKTLALWAEPFVELRVPKIFNLRREYPPRQKPASFNLERVLETMQKGGISSH